MFTVTRCLKSKILHENYVSWFVSYWTSHGKANLRTGYEPIPKVNSPHTAFHAIFTVVT